jgi:hypothetical protein
MPPIKKRRYAEDDDDEDDTPKKKKRSRRDDDDEDDDEDYTPPKKKRKIVVEDDEDEDDDEDERPRKKRSRDDDDDDDDEEDEPRGKTGWGAVAKKSKEVEENSGAFVNDFWLKKGESAIIQFLVDEPYCTDGHMIKTDYKDWMYTPCQLTHHKHCLMCRERIKKTWRATFKIADYRGNWNKDKKRFKHDTEIVKLWSVSQAIADQIQTYITKKKKKLTEIVFEVTRSGAGRNTVYTVVQAIDDDTDRPLKPKRIKDEFPPLKKLMAPMTDAQLEDKGFSAPDEFDADDDKPSKKKRSSRDDDDDDEDDAPRRKKGGSKKRRSDDDDDDDDLPF